MSGGGQAAPAAQVVAAEQSSVDAGGVEAAACLRYDLDHFYHLKNIGMSVCEEAFQYNTSINV